MRCVSDHGVDVVKCGINDSVCGDLTSVLGLVTVFVAYSSVTTCVGGMNDVSDHMRRVLNDVSDQYCVTMHR